MIKVYLKNYDFSLELVNSITKVYFENPKMFREFMHNIEEEVIISEDNELINFKKDILKISDPFNIDLKDKKIVNELYKVIKKNLTYEQVLKLTEIEANIISLLDDISISLDCRIEYEDDIDTMKLFSLFQVCLKEVEYNNFLEFFINYIKINIEIYKTSIVITNRLTNILTNVEYEQLKQELSLLEIKLLDFDLKEQELHNNDYLIDFDLCVI